MELGLIMNVVCGVELSGFLGCYGAVDASDGKEGKEDCEFDGRG